jgi:multidrug efflux pump
MRQALGMAVFSGMIGVTFFGIFLTPVFFYTLRRFAEQRGRTADGEQTHAHAPRPEH